MGISLYIERPPGHKTMDRTFNPDLAKRFSGEVWTFLGIPGSWMGEVTVWLEDVLGTRLMDWTVKPDLYGNYWIDTTFPDTLGDYVVKARWDKKTLIDRYDDATPIAFTVVFEIPLGTQVEASLSSTEVGVGSTVKASCWVTQEGEGLSGVTVRFSLTDPQGTFNSTLKGTGTNGLAELFIKALSVGSYSLLVEVPSVGWTQALTFSAVATKPPTKPPAAGSWWSSLPRYAVPVGLIGAGLGLIWMTRRAK